jgi:hypothetical protein
MREAMSNCALARRASRWRCLGSITLARCCRAPIGQLSTSLGADGGVARRHLAAAATGSSRELDALTDTFNELMASVAAAEAQTEARYTGAIRALATALDARDPYTARATPSGQRAVGGDRPHAGAVADDLEVLAPRRAAARHRQDRRARRRACASRVRDRRGVRRDQAAPGARRADPASVPFLARHIPIVELHHERPDGRGYPTACAATTSRWPRASSTSPTPTTR